MNDTFELSCYNDVKWAVKREWSFKRIKDHFVPPNPPDNILQDCIERAKQELYVESNIIPSEAGKLLYDVNS